MYWYLATKKLLELTVSNRYDISGLESLLNENLALFKDLKYFGLNPEHPDADIFIKKTLIYLYGDEFNISDINITESNVFEIMFSLWECLDLMVRIYKNKIPESLKEIQSQIYNSDKVNYLINAKKLIAKDIVNNELHPDFTPITKHIDIQIDFLIDNEKCKPILNPADTPPPKPFERLLKELDDNKLDQLFTFLSSKHKVKNSTFGNALIDTDIQSIKYVFGSDKKPTNFIGIRYTATNTQWLREIFTGLQKEVKYYTDKKTGKETRILSHEIVKQIPLYFIDKNNKPLNLSKNKQVDSIESDKIKEFLSTL